MAKERCACGEELHYTNVGARAIVEFYNEINNSEYVTVTNAMGDTWKIPRHYIALHGLKSSEIELLALRYGFEKVETSGPPG